jgi:hypothetical protein
MAWEEGPLLNRLLNATSVSEQTAALRTLKHEIIGHDQRKERWISSGIVPILSRILESSSQEEYDANKEVMSDGQRGGDYTSGAAMTEDQELCLQAVIITGSLAQGK